MKWIRVIIIMIVCFSTTAAFTQEAKTEEVNLDPNAKADSSKKSINAAASGTIGAANVIVRYHSPAVRNRLIWGGVVPYDEVWVTGAHSATSIDINRSFTISGKTIPAGKYAFFTIPGKNTWTVIINKNWEQHLADDYNEKEDVVRITVTPVQTEKKYERLQYYIQKENNQTGSIAVAWDRIMIRIPLTVN